MLERTVKHRKRVSNRLEIGLIPEA